MNIPFAFAKRHNVLAAAGDAFLCDPAYGALVVTHPLPWDVEPRIATLSELTQKHGKLICNVYTSDWLEAPGVKDLDMSAGGPLFRSMDRCFWTLGAWQRREEKRLAGSRSLQRRSSPDAAALAAARLSESAGRILTERESKAILSLYEVPVTAETLACTVAEAVAVVLVAVRVARGPSTQ